LRRFSKGELHPRRFFADTWRDIDRDADGHSAGSGSRDAATTAYVFVVAAICLTLSDLNYLGGEGAGAALIAFLDSPQSPHAHPFLWFLAGWMKPDDGPILFSQWYELWQLGYWAIVKVIAYFVIPAIAIAVHPRLHWRDIGFSTEGLSSHARLYALLFIPVFVAVVAVSFTEEFTTYYPFYFHATRSAFDFWIWELLYVAQFFSLEFFFRGFLLQPASRTMGSSSIVAMMIPYVMIHFGKPLPECFAAVLAGVVLGTLALKTRSIWAGFFLHVSVALSMDVLSCLHRDGVGFLTTIIGR